MMRMDLLEFTSLMAMQAAQMAVMHFAHEIPGQGRRLARIRERRLATRREYGHEAGANIFSATRRHQEL